MGILFDRSSAIVSITMVTRYRMIETVIRNAGWQQVAESKRFVWMIESVWSTHLAQKDRQRMVLYENTEISELTKHKSLRIFGLLLKITYSGTWSLFA